MISKVKYFFVLIRWFHELLGLFPFITLFYVINLGLSSNGFNLQISSNEFIVLCLGVQSLMIPGFILNDIMDHSIDKVNKPNTHIVGRIFSIQTSKVLFGVFSLITIGLSVYISHFIFIEWAWISSIVYILSVAYNVRLKRSPLFGNITIALLGAFVPLVIMFYADSYLRILNNMDIYLLIGIYAGLLFMVTIPRELSLDISDIEGDKKDGCKTLPILIGVRNSKIVVSIFLGLIVISSLVISSLRPPFAFTLLPFTCLTIYFGMELWKAQTRAQYIRNGRIIWISMILALIGSTVTTILIL